jgi:hypothetical protein
MVRKLFQRRQLFDNTTDGKKFKRMGYFLIFSAMFFCLYAMYRFRRRYRFVIEKRPPSSMYDPYLAPTLGTFLVLSLVLAIADPIGARF